MAARATIVEAGWASASSRLIAARAGVPLGAVNYHFASRQALLVEAALRGFEAIFEGPEAAWRDNGALRVIEWTLDEHTRSTALLFTETLTAALRDEQLRSALVLLLRGWRAGLDHLRADPSSGAAVGLASLLTGLLVQRLLDEDVALLDADALVEGLSRTLADMSRSGRQR